MTEPISPSSCDHATRVEGRCLACGDCQHEVVLNGACFICGTRELDPVAMSPKKSAEVLVPVDRLRRK